jgi:hypothetical protein
MITPAGCQSLFAFEQAAVDAAQASAHAKLQAKLSAKAQRAILKRQAELDKANRRFKRDEKRKGKTPDEYAQCGIRWYCRSPHNVALGNYWTNCHACGQLLIYTSDPNAKPQVCAGRKP